MALFPHSLESEGFVRLSASSEDHRLLVESLADAAFVISPQGRIKTWNRAAHALLGWEPREVLDKPLLELRAAAERAAGALVRELEAATRAGRYEGAATWSCRDGSLLRAETRFAALTDAAGRARGFGVVLRANTGASPTEERLRLSEERTRLLVEAVRDYAIITLDREGNVIDWNTGAEHAYGFSAREVLGTHFSRFYPEEERARGKCEWELSTAERDGRVEDEGLRIRRDGSTFWANVVLTPLWSPSGELLGYAKITRDLTERRRAEESARELARQQAARTAAEEAESVLRESEEKYRELSQRLDVILEGISEGILVQDRSGRFIYANTAGALHAGCPSREALLATPREQLLAQFEILDESGKPFPLEELPGRRAMRGLEPGTALLHTRNKLNGRDGWAQVRASAVLHDGVPSLAVTIWHDVTAEVRRTHALRFLSEASAVLAQSLNIDETLRTLANTVVPAFADWCAVHVTEGAPGVGAEVRKVATAHWDPKKVELARELEEKYPADPNTRGGLWTVLRTGQPQLYPEIPAATLQAVARNEAHLRALEALGMSSGMIVPLRARDRILGAITFVWAESAKHYDEQDLALAEELASRAATAIENARLYEAERTAREHVALLARAGECFASTASRDALLRCVTDVALPTFGDFAFLDVLSPDGVHQRRVSGLDEARAHAFGGSPQDVPMLLTPVLVADVEAHGLGRAQLSLEDDHKLRELGVKSVLRVPIWVDHECAGVLTTCFMSADRRHTVEHRSLAEEYARRAGVALERHRLLEAAHEAARRAEEAARIKDEFLATVSHELRTPLNAILGWSCLLRKRRVEPSVEHALEVIHRNCEAQIHLVDDLLDVSRIITGKFRLDPKPVDLAVVVAEALEVVTPSAAAKNLRIVREGSEDGYWLTGDADRLKQVAWNLLSNAIRFTEPGGQVRIALNRTDTGVTLTVEDTGKGIAPELLPYIFERFTQHDGSTTRRFGGLGLGLAIVRHIVELHGGCVTASSPGLARGSTFQVTLPGRTWIPSRLSQPGPLRPASLRGRQGADVKGLRVLVVDDETDARELLDAVLSSAEAIVETAPSASVAFEALKRFRPHVLVSDIGMPEEDGYSLMRRIRELPASEGGGVPAIALTAFTRAEDRARALAAGYSTHLGKPAHPDELLWTVANLGAARDQRS
jgi:PAS domain S-box-containing protein